MQRMRAVNVDLLAKSYIHSNISMDKSIHFDGIYHSKMSRFPMICLPTGHPMPRPTVGLWQDWPLRSAAGWVSFTASEAQRRWNEANEDPEASWKMVMLPCSSIKTTAVVIGCCCWL